VTVWFLPFILNAAITPSYTSMLGCFVDDELEITWKEAAITWRNEENYKESGQGSLPNTSIHHYRGANLRNY
jgi:hypothetical protein